MSVNRTVSGSDSGCSSTNRIAISSASCHFKSIVTPRISSLFLCEALRYASPYLRKFFIFQGFLQRRVHQDFGEMMGGRFESGHLGSDSLRSEERRVGKECR